MKLDYVAYFTFLVFFYILHFLLICYIIFRSVYEYMIAQHREKGRSKGGKGEIFSLEQMQQAHTEYEEEATLCVFRLKSLKQGQSRSLLTQAARHHTSQVGLYELDYHTL